MPSCCRTRRFPLLRSAWHERVTKKCVPLTNESNSELQTYTFGDASNHTVTAHPDPMMPNIGSSSTKGDEHDLRTSANLPRSGRTRPLHTAGPAARRHGRTAHPPERSLAADRTATRRLPLGRSRHGDRRHTERWDA